MYRINKHKTVLGKEYFCIEKRGTIFSKWQYVSFSIRDNIMEVLALRFLLEKGESVFSPFKASERIKIYE